MQDNLFRKRCNHITCPQNWGLMNALGSSLLDIYCQILLTETDFFERSLAQTLFPVNVAVILWSGSNLLAVFKSHFRVYGCQYWGFAQLPLQRKSPSLLLVARKKFQGVCIIQPKNGALIDAPLIPAGFRSFLWIPVPFQWNSPAKILKYWYSGTYTRTVPRMEWHWNAWPEWMLKIAKYGKFCKFTRK